MSFHVYDTTLRDGAQQEGMNLSVTDKLAIAPLLDELGAAYQFLDLTDLPADLPGVPASVQADLAGTSTRVALARRFYNDAVRDTLALRRRRKVRYFRLAGTAPRPEYFEIAEPDLPAGPPAA